MIGFYSQLKTYGFNNFSLNLIIRNLAVIH